MDHFDSMDLNRSGKLYPEDFAAIAMNKERSRKMADARQKLHNASRAAGLERKNSGRWLLREAQKLEQSGDYAAATKELEAAAAAWTDTGVEIASAEAVRSKVADLTRLAEMKWRYRVVNVGESPFDAALSLLSTAKELLDGHQQASGLPAAQFRHEWARELSAVAQSRGVAHVIFCKTREQDGRIEALLTEALGLRRDAAMPLGEAETLNALGSLKQKQKRFDDAQSFYLRSLQLRRQIEVGLDEAGGSPSQRAGAPELSGDTAAEREKEREQVVAQSLVSLGNLAIERGTAANEATDAEGARGFYSAAEAHMEEAKQAYIRGFHETHPKVAWAMEGLAKIYTSQGKLDQALAEFEAAAAIRRSLQATVPEAQMFKDELKSLEKAVGDLKKRTQSDRKAGDGTLNA